MPDSENNIKRLLPDPIPPKVDEQERFDAMQLIRAGRKTNDQEVVAMGQARLRYAEGRPTPEDLELLGK